MPTFYFQPGCVLTFLGLGLAHLLYLQPNSALKLLGQTTQQPDNPTANPTPQPNNQTQGKPTARTRAIQQHNNHTVRTKQPNDAVAVSLVASYVLFPMVASYGCCLWLLPMVASYGCFLLLVVASYGCFLWLLPMVASYGCFRCPTPMVASYGCFLWLDPMVASYGCFLWLLPMAASFVSFLWLLPMVAPYKL